MARLLMRRCWALFRSDCTVAFLWPKGGSFAFHVDEDGQDVVRINYGVWQPLGSVTLSDWQMKRWRW